MESPSKSSQKAKNVVIALLSIWSIISLIIIVVWSTSPDLKGASKYRSELQEMTEKLEGTKVVCSKNKIALEEMLQEAREAQERQRAENLVLLGQLNATNFTLAECRQENVNLGLNISALLDEVEQLHQRETNLTAQLQLQEELVEVLQHNMTLAALQTDACFSKKAAADSQMLAAQSETRACESSQEYLQKQLQKCKGTNSAAPPQKQQDVTSKPLQTSATGAAVPLAGIHVAVLLISSGLHLIT
ncbi:uncharacterized protein si:ch211-1a19.3 [Synchiropus splendidus]|uniref:uncharacterized protein si:ch211-1a19.3 n=1 Tax=Synchiropus splendidus TaxID=270530 RepID=UPI00237DFD0F|nr:uncharacterized protein si:ch211-1a19.3 [Synchiropus splendidus]